MCGFDLLYTRLSLSLVGHSSRFLLDNNPPNHSALVRAQQYILQHSTRNALQLTRIEFRLFPFRSPLLGEYN